MDNVIWVSVVSFFFLEYQSTLRGLEYIKLRKNYVGATSFNFFFLTALNIAQRLRFKRNCVAASVKECVVYVTFRAWEE